jgi:hypothetical protein
MTIATLGAIGEVMFVGVMVMEAGTAEEEICCSVWLPRRNRVPFPFWMGNTSSTKQQ